MHQAIHILRKDVRYLWREICLFAVIAALFAWRDYLWAEILLPVTAAYLIARLVHAEAIPGDTQFWLTRPYEWKSLFAAKLLFILIFLNVPVFLARIYILVHSGFPLSVEFGPLMWSQFLMLAAFCLPIAALAAVTVDNVSFIFSALVLAVIGFIIQGPLSGQAAAGWPDGTEWVRTSFFVAVVIITAVCLLRLQYKTRRTTFARLLASGLLSIGVLIYMSIPPAFAMELQTWMSRKSPYPVQVRLNTEIQNRTFAVPKRDFIQLSVPLTLEGLPSNVEARADALWVTLEATNGRKWETFTQPGRSAGAGTTSLDSILFVDRSFFAEERKQPVSMSGSLYLTLFSGSRETTATLGPDPLNVGDGLQCYVNPISTRLHCRSAFRWPALLVYAKVRNDRESIWPLFSYSPFPAGMELNYIEEHQAGGPPPHAPQATILVMEPLTHFRTNFRIEKLDMEEFAQQR